MPRPWLIVLIRRRRLEAHPFEFDGDRMTLRFLSRFVMRKRRCSRCCQLVTQPPHTARPGWFVSEPVAAFDDSTRVGVEDRCYVRMVEDSFRLRGLEAEASSWISLHLPSAHLPHQHHFVELAEETIIGHGSACAYACSCCAWRCGLQRPRRSLLRLLDRQGSSRGFGGGFVRVGSSSFVRSIPWAESTQLRSCSPILTIVVVPNGRSRLRHLLRTENEPVDGVHLASQFRLVFLSLL